jgi:hypothetical protein
MHASRTLVRLATVASVALATLILAAPMARSQDKPQQPPAATPAAGAPATTPNPAAPPATTPAPTTTTTAAPADPSAPVASTADANPPGIRLRKLEQRVQELKEQAWRIKARVGMLKEAVLGGGIGARASIQHENKMGGSFRLIKVLYALDGTQVYSKSDDTGKLDEIKNFEVLSGPIAPGNHTLSVMLVYRGHGFGVFEYLKKYKFTVRSSHTFTVAEGKASSITVVGYERGGATTPMEKRPAIDFRVTVVAESPATTTAAPKAE